MKATEILVDEVHLSIYYLSICLSVYLSSIYLSIFFLGPHPWHMALPRLGVKSELQLLAYTTATATPDLSHVCNLPHS